MNTVGTAHAPVVRGFTLNLSGAGQRFIIAVTLVCDLLMGFGGFYLAQALGYSDVTAYLLSCVGPMLSAVILLVHSGRVSGVSVAIVGFNLLSVLVTFIGDTDDKVLLYKDCVVTALIGLAFIVSLRVGKPLYFYFAERFTTDNTPDDLAHFAAQWSQPIFREAMRVTTAVWAVAMLAESAITSVAVSYTSFSAGFAFDMGIPVISSAAALLATAFIGRRYNTRDDATAPTLVAAESR